MNVYYKDYVLHSIHINIVIYKILYIIQIAIFDNIAFTRYH